MALINLVYLPLHIGADSGFDRICGNPRCMPRSGWPRKKPQKMVANDEATFSSNNLLRALSPSLRS